MPDRPQVTITLTGDFRSGKSILAKLIQTALTSHKLEHKSSGVEQYDPSVLVPALRSLASRGLVTTIVEVNSAPHPQIDATVGFRRTSHDNRGNANRRKSFVSRIEPDGDQRAEV